MSIELIERVLNIGLQMVFYGFCVGIICLMAGQVSEWRAGVNWNSKVYWYDRMFLAGVGLGAIGCGAGIILLLWGILEKAIKLIQ